MLKDQHKVLHSLLQESWLLSNTTSSMMFFLILHTWINLCVEQNIEGMDGNMEEQASWAKSMKLFDWCFYPIMKIYWRFFLKSKVTQSWLIWKQGLQMKRRWTGSTEIHAMTQANSPQLRYGEVRIEQRSVWELLQSEMTR